MLKLIEKFQNFLNIWRTNPWNKFVYPRNFKVTKNIFSYTQVHSAFVLQEDFDICLRFVFTFCLFPLQRNFDIFHVLLFSAFLWIFDNIYLPMLYTQKKLSKMFYNFLHHNFLHLNFLHQNFPYQNQIVYLGIFSL